MASSRTTTYGWQTPSTTVSSGSSLRHPGRPAMHSIVFYELTRTRTELDREAERRRLARTDLPLLQRAPVGRRPPGARSPRAIRWSPWIRASSRDRDLPNPDQREPPRAGRHGTPAAARPAEELAVMPPGRFREAGDGLAGHRSRRPGEMVGAAPADGG